MDTNNKVYNYYPCYRYNMHKDSMFVQFILDSICKALKDMHIRYAKVIDTLDCCGLDYHLGYNNFFTPGSRGFINVNIQIFVPTEEDYIPLHHNMRIGDINP